MKLSGFQFSNPSLLRLEYSINSDFNDQEFEDLKLDFKVGIKMHPTENRALVELEMTLGEKSNKSPVHIVLLMNSEFKWEDGIYDPETLDSLLNVNAPSLLASYIRPIVATLTAASGIQALHIPFINFTTDKEDDKA